MYKSKSLNRGTSGRKSRTRGIIVKSFNYNSRHAKRLRLDDPSITVYDWIDLKKACKRSKLPKIIEEKKSDEPYDYELCKPKREQIDSESGYESDSSCVSWSSEEEARKYEWGIQIPSISPPIEIFKKAIKKRVMEMRKRPRKGDNIEEKKGYVLQRVYNPNSSRIVFKIRATSPKPTKSKLSVISNRAHVPHSIRELTSSANDESPFSA